MGDEENLNGVPRRGAEAREEGAGRSDLENNSRLILINFVIDFFFSFFCHTIFGQILLGLPRDSVYADGRDLVLDLVAALDYRILARKTI